MNTTQTQPRLRRLPDVGGFRRYEVTLDGEVLGEVSQGTASTVHAYAGRTYGFQTTRKTWEWTTPDNAGDFELRTRTEAVEGLVEFQRTRVR